MSQVKRAADTAGDTPEKKEKSELDPSNIFFRAIEDHRSMQEAEIKEFDKAWTKIAALQALLTDADTKDALDKFISDWDMRGVKAALDTIKCCDRSRRPTAVEDVRWWDIMEHVPKMFERAIPGSRCYVYNIINGNGISGSKQKLKSMTKDPEWLKIIHTLAKQKKEAEQYFKR